MIDDSGAVIPDVEEINESVDTQFNKKAKVEHWQKCAYCDYYGNWEQMQFHMKGQHGVPS